VAGYLEFETIPVKGNRAWREQTPISDHSEGFPIL
jgi:hypothetical protein